MRWRLRAERAAADKDLPHIQLLGSTRTHKLFSASSSPTKILPKGKDVHNEPATPQTYNTEVRRVPRFTSLLGAKITGDTDR